MRPVPRALRWFRLNISIAKPFRLLAFIGLCLSVPVAAQAQTVLSQIVLQSEMPLGGALITIGVSDASALVPTSVLFVDHEALIVGAVDATAKLVTVSRGWGGSRIESHTKGTLMYAGAAASFYSSPPGLGATCDNAPVTPYIDVAAGAVYSCVASSWAYVGMAASIAVNAAARSASSVTYASVGNAEGIIGTSTTASLRFRSTLTPPATSILEGDWWVECSGTSPSRTCALKVRDSGVTRSVAFVTF